MLFIINNWTRKTYALAVRYDRQLLSLKIQGRYIGEYSAKKIYYFPSWRKNCEKLSLYFSLSEVENFLRLHFFGIKLSK